MTKAPNKSAALLACQNQHSDHWEIITWHWILCL